MFVKEAVLVFGVVEFLRQQLLDWRKKENENISATLLQRSCARCLTIVRPLFVDRQF
jgi:hypothetical protein